MNDFAPMGNCLGVMYIQLALGSLKILSFYGIVIIIKY